MIAAALALGGCAETQVTNHTPQSERISLPIERLGHTLLVVENALPHGDHEAWDQTADLTTLISGYLGQAVGGSTTTHSDADLLSQARAQGLDSVTIVRIEEYARHGTLSVNIALPPVSWETHTLVSLRLRVLDVKTGHTEIDLRQDRKNGGPMTLRSRQDLPKELQESLSSLVIKAG
jgi:hypothetical protein